jgi:prepilin-type N-terminal cleavage/methylation domain-containing protein
MTDFLEEKVRLSVLHAGIGLIVRKVHMPHRIPKAFTLLELLVVVAIMGLLVVLTLPADWPGAPQLSFGQPSVPDGGLQEQPENASRQL